MRKFLKVRYLVGVLAVIVLAFVINKLLVDFIQKPVAMVEVENIIQDVEIRKSELTTNSIATWDNSNLKIYNLQGDLVEEIIGNGFYTNVYFENDEILILDKQLNVLYRYSTSGDLKSKIQLSGSVYSVFNKGGEIYIHRKDELNNNRLETLSKLEGEKRESPVYETSRFIINFLREGSRLYLSEITAENYSYKSVLNIIEGRDKQIFDFNNETVLDMKTAGKKLLVITNKNLYLIDNNDRQRVDLNNFKDYRFEDKGVVVLYDNKLVRFNNDLSIADSYNIGISNMGLIYHNRGYFVYGPTDIVGYVGQKREFTKSFDSLVTSVHSNGQALLVAHKYNVKLYAFESIERDQ